MTSESIANGLATRHNWWEREIEPFAQALIPDTLAYRTTHTFEIAVILRITDHADRAAFMPYAAAVTRRATAAFRTMAAEADPD
ncbi:hypothetical protein [Streptomyces sp. NPDC017949]|uniref:hypothetical protein n=1 Tax=Streptomyces sp. NPDC017949 TaxID=3365020 RepID=UPI0029A6380B|nr:hypothetical protein [Streptomyces sp. DK15]MDX2389356.1 hypothetical protein [Streptomyces sp. DK15]